MNPNDLNRALQTDIKPKFENPLLQELVARTRHLVGLQLTQENLDSFIAIRDGLAVEVSEAVTSLKTMDITVLSIWA